MHLSLSLTFNFRQSPDMQTQRYGLLYIYCSIEVIKKNNCKRIFKKRKKNNFKTAHEKQSDNENKLMYTMYEN